MRDFTKSMLSFSWAMSLFGCQQMLKLLSPAEAAKSFDKVTDATEGELKDLLKATFEAGDKLQRRLVDLTMGAFTGQAVNPGGRANANPDVIRQEPDLTRQSAGVASRTAQQPAESSIRNAQRDSRDEPRKASGWGPMPGSSDATAASRSQAAETSVAAEPDISPDYPFKPNYIEVLGSKMHYIDEGAG